MLSTMPSSRLFQDAAASINIQRSRSVHPLTISIMMDEATTTVTTQMLIRRPVRDVFNAFVDPATTTRFWFTGSSGRVETGATIRWEWEMFDVGTTVRVLAVEQDKRILVEWDDPPCPVEWQFSAHGMDATLVRIIASGFRGTGEDVLAQAVDSKGGFTMVLAGAKALLEHGIELGLIRDQFPGEA
jgi:uncharacterized protein YndB with AHSA1/START domain